MKMINQLKSFFSNKKDPHEIGSFFHLIMLSLSSFQMFLILFLLKEVGIPFVHLLSSMSIVEDTYNVVTIIGTISLLLITFWFFKEIFKQSSSVLQKRLFQ